MQFRKLQLALIIVGIWMLGGCQSSELVIDDPEAWLDQTVADHAISRVYSVDLNGVNTFYPSIRLTPENYFIEDLDALLAEAVELFQAVFDFDKVQNVEVIWMEDDFPNPASEILYIKLTRNTFEQIEWRLSDPTLLRSLADQFDLK